MPTIARLSRSFLIQEKEKILKQACLNFLKGWTHKVFMNYTIMGFYKYLPFFGHTCSESWTKYHRYPNGWLQLHHQSWNSFDNWNHHMQSTDGVVVSKTLVFQEHHSIFQPRSNREMYRIYRDIEQNSIFTNTMRYYDVGRRKVISITPFL